MPWDHFHEIKITIAISLLQWIHFLSGFIPTPCPYYTARGPPSFFYNEMVTCWGNLHYSQIDKGVEFVGSFAWLCKGLNIIYRYITVGNSKANGQVERTIWILRNCIQHGLMKEPTSFWIKPLGLSTVASTYKSMIDDGYCAISIGYWLSAATTKLGHYRDYPCYLTSPPQTRKKLTSLK